MSQCQTFVSHSSSERMGPIRRNALSSFVTSPCSHPVATVYVGCTQLCHFAPRKQQGGREHRISAMSRTSWCASGKCRVRASGCELTVAGHWLSATTNGPTCGRHPTLLIARRFNPGAEVLAKVRAIVPARFLKTPESIHHHTAEILRYSATGYAAAGSCGRTIPPPNEPGRTRDVPGAVTLMQRTAAVSGLASAFADRAALRSQGGPGGAVARLHNPLAVFGGAPGGGWVARGSGCSG